MTQVVEAPQKLKRIDVQMVLDAYRDTGLVPTQGAVHDHVPGPDGYMEAACALGALVGREAARQDNMSYVLKMMESRGFETHYLTRFVNGFDGIHLSGENSEWPEESKIGFRDGCEVREAVFG